MRDRFHDEPNNVNTKYYENPLPLVAKKPKRKENKLMQFSLSFTFIYFYQQLD